MMSFGSASCLLMVVPPDLDFPDLPLRCCLTHSFPSLLICSLWLLRRVLCNSLFSSLTTSWAYRLRLSANRRALRAKAETEISGVAPKLSVSDIHSFNVRTTCCFAIIPLSLPSPTKIRLRFRRLLVSQSGASRCVAHRYPRRLPRPH